MVQQLIQILVQLLHPVQPSSLTDISIALLDNTEVPSPPNPTVITVDSDESISFKLLPVPSDATLDEDAVYWGIYDGGSYVDFNVPRSEQSTYHTPVLEVTPKQDLTGDDKVIILYAIYAPNGVGGQGMISKPFGFTIHLIEA